MKKILSVFLAVIIVAGIFTACKKTNDTVTITFVQEGRENIVRTVRSGESLKDIPQPAEREGYEVGWNITDFSSISEDMRVVAVFTPKKFIITYSYNPLLDNEYTVVLEKKTQTVEFGSEFVLATATAKSATTTLVFVGWTDRETGETVKSGIYDKARDTTLIAKFEPEQREWI